MEHGLSSIPLPTHDRGGAALVPPFFFSETHWAQGVKCIYYITPEIQIYRFAHLVLSPELTVNTCYTETVPIDLSIPRT